MPLLQGIVIVKSLASPTMYISFFVCLPNLTVPQPLLLLSPLALLKKSRHVSHLENTNNVRMLKELLRTIVLDI